MRILLMLESAAGLDSIGRLSPAARERLGGLIFGAVDHAADLGLPTIDFDHPVTLQARCTVVAAAARFGVPAIDGMTLAYPVVDRALDAPANRQRFLDRMQRVSADARGSFELGMTGKWVGHPGQLFAVELAHRSVFSAERVGAAARQIRGYRAGVETGRGVTMVDGSMADRATERHAVGLLRRAAAAGRFDPEDAASLGVISASEAAELHGPTPAVHERGS
jgi:citrate lyase beta subunit